MTIAIFKRHGEHIGLNDPLTTAGKESSLQYGKLIAHHFKGSNGMFVVASSPKIRTEQTAELILEGAGQTNAPIKILKGLDESATQQDILSALVGNVPLTTKFLLCVTHYPVIKKMSVIFNESSFESKDKTYEASKWQAQTWDEIGLNLHR